MSADSDSDLDRIERSIRIDASPERVFALVSRPGWWINEHEVDPDPHLTYEGDIAVLEHEAWGTFRLGLAEQRPPHYVAFRWFPRDGEDATLVEFFVEETVEETDGGVTLRVVESGFTRLGKSAEDLQAHLDDNIQGWEAELAAARRFVMGASA